MQFNYSYYDRSTPGGTFMKATLRGTEIYFDIAGMQLAPTRKNDFELRPTLFMLHGGPGGDHLRFKQHSLELQDVAQLVFIDHRGCGRSKKTKAKDYTLENNIEDIEALRKHLGLEKICILGTSYGGIVAQGYAIRYPKRVEKLILVATASSFHFLDEAKKYLATHGSKEQIACAKSLWDGSFKNEKQLLHFFQIMDSFYCMKAKKNKKALTRSKTTWSYEALNQGFSTFLKAFNFIPRLKKINCPTLILAGDKDWICAASQSKIIAKHISQAKIKIFKNCGHAIAVDAHQDYIKTIQKFLKS